MKTFISLIIALLIASFTAQGQVAGDFRSKPGGTGLWNDFNAWERYDGTAWVAAVSGQLPASTSSVEIQAAHAMTVNAPALASGNLSVNGSLTYHATTVSALTVTGSVTVSPTGSFTSPSSGTVVTHALNIGGLAPNGAVTGNLTVDGVFNMNAFSTAGVVVTFYGAPNATISGAGSTINFFSLIANKGSGSNASILDITGVITCAPGSATNGNRLNAALGTIRLSSASTLSPYYGTTTINGVVNGRLWLNNAAALIQSVGAGTPAGANGTYTLAGSVQIDAGTLSLGNGSSTIQSIDRLSLGSVNATLNVYGALWSGSATNLTMTSGGSINLSPLPGIPAGSALFTYGVFQFNGTAITFTNGNITVTDPNPNGGTFNNTINITAGTCTFAGSTLRFGNGTSDLDGSTNGFLVYAPSTTFGNIIVNNAPGSTKLTRMVKLGTNTTIAGNLTINPGTANQFLLNGFTLTARGNISNAGNFIFDGTASTGLVFTGTTPQTIGGAGTFSTNVNNLTINNTSGASPAVDFQIPVSVSNSLTLTKGSLGSSNASPLTIGNSAVSTSFNLTRSGGSLVVAPTFALAGVTLNSVTYSTPSPAAPLTTDVELPAATPITTFTVSNSSGVTLDKPVTCTTLALTSGVLTATGANTMTVTGTLPANITGGSATSYVNGPLTRMVPNNAAAANYRFPVGKTGYRLFEFATLSTAGTGTAAFTAEAFDAGPYAGTAGTGLSSINTDKYWALSATLGSVTVSASTVRLTDSGLLITNRIGQSDNATGTYNTVGGSVAGGTTITSTNPIDYSTVGAGTYFRVGSATAFAAGSYAIGPQASYAGYTGRFPSLTAAVAAMTGVPLPGHMIFEFQNDYSPAVETYPVSMTASITSSASATVTIRPAANVSSLINLSAAGTALSNAGADYLTLDGRNGGTGTNRFLQFTNTTTGGPAVSLTGDALYNQLHYCVLKGSTTTASSGILLIGAVASVGNNNYTVNQCLFDGSGVANNCLYATGLGSDATITNCNFFDYRNGAGINLASGSNNGVIDNNNFYQTLPYNGFAGTTYGIIASGGNNCQISNNNVGGSGPGIAGTWTVTATAPAAYNFTGISASLATTSKIYNNRIQNFDWKSTPSIWTGINGSGTVNIGTDGANVIGSNTGNDNIKITYYNTNGAAVVNGIIMAGTTVRTENNSIGSITTLLSGATGIGSSIYGIVNSASTAVISNNVIGSATTPLSINAANQSTIGNTQNVYGVNFTSLGTVTLSGNTIANMYSGITFPSASVGMMRGMKFPNSGTSITIANNSIFSLSTPQSMTGTGISVQNIVGIDINASSASVSVSGNTIYDLVNTASTGAVNVFGIYCQTSSGATNRFERNYIHSFVTQSNTAVQTGFNINFGACTFQNNIIRLGTDKDGNSITTTPLITGVLKSSGAQTSNFYYNTVSIGGTGVAAGAVNTYALNVTLHSTEDIRDNILLNTRSGGGKNYAIRIPGTTPNPAGITCNYNDLHAPGTGGMVGFYNNADQATLAGWQAATARDQNSVSVDPQFVSATDMHPAHPALNNAGTPVAGITTDFANVTRNVTTPDIGAYEFNVTYTITASAGPNGTLSPLGVVTVNHGADQAFTYAANSGYRVSSVTVDGSPVLPIPASPYTFSNVVANGHTIDVQFTPDTFTLTVNATNGTVDANPPAGPYASGTVVTLTASPAPGYQFSGWTGALSGSANPATLTMDADKTVTASFTINAYALNLSIVGNGAVAKVPDQASYDHGTSVQLTATPAFGYSFLGWSGDLTGTTNPANVVMDGVKNITATFGGAKVFVSRSASDTTARIVYPDNTWRALVSPPLYNGADDWSTTNAQPVSFFIVPEVGATIGAADMTFEWNPAVLELANVDFAGSIFSGPDLALAISDQLGTTNRVRLNASLVAPHNATVAPGNYVAKLNFLLKNPGHASVAAILADFRYFNPGQVTLPVTAHSGEVKVYLGDVASPASVNAADGKLDISDLSPWSLSYWSGVPGYVPGMANYQAKNDIGPTMTGSYFSLPAHLVSNVPTPGPDAKIDFEDLVIFSIGYGMSSRGELPKVAPVKQDAPIVVAVGDYVPGDVETRIPVRVSGGVSDVRAISLVLSGQFGKLLGVENGTLLKSYSSPVPVLSRAQGTKVYVDLAIMGLANKGVSSEGEVIVLRFEGSARVGIAKAEFRSSLNAPLQVTVKDPVRDLPTSFALAQNYPNPFNPSTIIEYEVPAQAKVEVAVYNVLGELVALLVDEVQDGGFYRTTWNGRTVTGGNAATGVYFCRMHAGDFTGVKKMLLMK